MKTSRGIVVAVSTAVLAAVGYGAYSYLRVDRPLYPLPPDDPRCPSGMAYIPDGTAPIWTDPPPEPPHAGIYRVAPVPEWLPVSTHVAAFCLDRSDVTAAEYEECVRSGACPAPGRLPYSNADCTYGVPERAFHPMNCISWDDANRYCKAKGKRLPLEDEWAYAAQGGPAGNKHPWGSGDGTGKACRSAWTGIDTTCAVRSFPAESFGLFDMGGNVAAFTAHPCTEERPCDPDYSPVSGFHWESDVFVDRAENGHVPSAVPAPGDGIRCAK